MSINTTWIQQGQVRLALFLIIFYPTLATALPGEDFCAWTTYPSSTAMTLRIPDPVLLIDERVPVGTVMLTRTLRSSSLDVGRMICSIAPNFHKYELHGLSLVPGYSDVYESGIEGIGLKIFSHGAIGGLGSADSGYLPSNDNSSWEPYRPRNQFKLELVRVGQRVGSGTIPLDFRVSLTSWVFSAGSFPRLSWRGVGSATVINEAMYASCEPAKPVDTVDMGQVLGKDLRAGRAPVKSFSFDVRCKGLKRPNHLVRAYFEGKSPGTGLLDIQTGAEQASGVALALKDAQDNPLQFGSGRTYPLGLTGEDAEGHLYRFEGSAQYVRTDAPLTTGQADAALTYVLDYN
ncbi:fimbrial protein [Pseudomonas sp. JM0905a]|uniref:fimbrial protein n=1 Tax=Pseudomonas sp. JM0905a TaxID=2772484 RepID=UPI0016837660|nr:fimbrial protein [Pseudomonas sp. JM0905a]MBD2840362.1 fimbrial protein [Pseudomonas sp. JM0905a]